MFNLCPFFCNTSAVLELVVSIFNCGTYYQQCIIICMKRINVYLIDVLFKLATINDVFFYPICN